VVFFESFAFVTFIRIIFGLLVLDMSIISITKLYDLLSAKLGKETAGHLTTYLENKIRVAVEHKSNLLATKEDVANAKADTIKWMFIFWIGQVLATFGFILIYLKK